MPDVPGERDSESMRETSETPTMRGRLKEKRAFWQSFCRSKLVMSWILLGFPLLWLAGPPAARWLANHGSAGKHADFVSKSVQDLVATGTVMPVSQQPHCVLPLGVVERPGTGKLRLILDARYVNEHLVIPSFKYETLSTLHTVLQPGDYLLTADLTSGYHHLDIRPEYWTFLGFSWEGQFYVFTQLPFGLAPACWAFTKLTRELITLWRSEGLRVSGYIDDSIHAHQSANELLLIRDKVLGDFGRAGFIVSTKKCMLTPSQQASYLGATIDTVAGVFTVPQAKRLALHTAISSTLENPHRCHIRAIARIVGTVMSMSYSFGSLSTVMTRRLAQWQGRAMRAGLSLDHHAPLDSNALGELRFWHESFTQFDGSNPIWAPSHMHTVKVFTDAAGSSDWTYGGWGGWSDMGGRRMASGRWQMDTKGLSSGFLEMLAIDRVIRSINSDGSLTRQRVLLHTDSQVAHAVLSKWGSMVPNIQDVCSDLFWYCLQHSIRLVATWIPRTLNVLSDSLSKHEELSDWQLNPALFRELEHEWGPFVVDLFASEENHQCERFFSFFYTPSSAGVNAFAQFWPRTSWCNPPFAVIGRALRHAAACQTRMAMLLPFWPGASWWHIIIENEAIFRSCVWDCKVLPQQPRMFLGTPTPKGQPCMTPGWSTIALLFDFGAPCEWVVPIPNL